MDEAEKRGPAAHSHPHRTRIREDGRIGPGRHASLRSGLGGRRENRGSADATHGAGHSTTNDDGAHQGELHGPMMPETALRGKRAPRGWARRGVAEAGRGEDVRE
ncbi:hypothetical protein HMPREF0682_2418 [Propionibacterium acidifaciens F0233]|uniref:Uncharacterized protein n=1 Tax=Propionibacterium acidifaciens F0233 TaxID=553198 RepID=U2RPJ7_9ACTN|nr:hypothetical protein HMPREF0682_2418 [Propionibacterium acidifaciens F0233]